MSARWIAALVVVALAFPLAAQTSMEEYLYVTLGYQEQLRKGLDDKKGYSWKQLLQHKFSFKKGGFITDQYQTGVFDFEGLYRDGEVKPCAIAAIFRQTEGTYKKDGVFICIPHPATEKDIKAKAEKHLLEETRFSERVFQQYAIGLEKLAMKLATL